MKFAKYSVVVLQVIFEKSCMTFRGHYWNEQHQYYLLTFLCCFRCETKLSDSKHMRFIYVSALAVEISFFTSRCRKLMYSGKLYLEEVCSSSSPLLSHRSMVLGEYTSKASVLCLPQYKFLTLSSLAGQNHRKRVIQIDFWHDVVWDNVMPYGCCAKPKLLKTGSGSEQSNHV